MRKRTKSKSKAMSVHAVSGTEVAMLGLNPSEEAAEGLLGFTVLRRKGKTGPFIALNNDKRTFRGVHDKAVKAGKRPDSTTAPIQTMLWSDYQVDPGKYYTYRVIPVYGKPGALKPDKVNTVDIYIRTENPKSRDDAIYFNGGIAISSAYSRKFKEYLKWYPDPDLSEFLTTKAREKNPDAAEVFASRPYLKPDEVKRAMEAEGKQAESNSPYEMLSRGLDKAMLDFIGQAKGPKYSLHAVLFELTYAPAIQAFVHALESGAKVRIVHHAKREGSFSLKYNTSAETVSYATTKVGKKKVRESERPIKSESNREILAEKVPDSFLRDALEAIGNVGLKNGSDKKILKAFDDMFIQRTQPGSLSHNKVIILLKDNKPIQVWTGSTNITEGGIFGQSNVGHVVRDEKVAKAYNDYWKKLAEDPPRLPKKPNKKTGKGGVTEDEAIATWTVKKQKDLDPRQAPPKGITPIFTTQDH